MNSVTSKILSVLLIICLAASLFSVIFHMNNEEYKTETAIYAQAYDSVSFKAVYVRDEEVIDYNGSGVISYTVPDGGKLSKGSVIAEVYADESQIDIKRQLSELNSQMEILKKIQNPGTAESAQPSNLSELIDEKYRKIINAREKGNLKDISSDSDNLVVLLSTYQIVTDKAVDFAKRLNDLNTRIASLKATETIPLDSIVSDKAAYFVSYADGYEDVLSMDKLSSITPELIDEIKDDNSYSDGKVIGKLISGYEWYAVGVIDNTDVQFSIDDVVRLKFQSTSDEVKGVITDIRNTKTQGKSIVVVKCSDITYDLVQHRTERVEMIRGEFEGIKVSRKAIRFKDVEEEYIDEETGAKMKRIVNCKGVNVKLGEQINFKRLDVIYEGDNFVLSSLNAGSNYVSLYDDIIVEGVGADGS